MPSSEQTIIIKKYANRRLYNTGSSAYVTLEDLAGMVKKGEEFVVQDAKTGDDITRSVLAQIIFDQEAKEGQNLLPVAFLRQLIGLYGDSMQAIVPSFLEHSMASFAREQDKLREQMNKTFGQVGTLGIGPMDEQARANMEMFRKAMTMFMPFGAAQMGSAADSPKTGEGSGENSELKALKEQMAQIQKKLDRMG